MQARTRWVNGWFFRPHLPLCTATRPSLIVRPAHDNTSVNECYHPDTILCAFRFASHPCPTHLYTPSACPPGLRSRPVIDPSYPFGYTYAIAILYPIAISTCWSPLESLFSFSPFAPPRQAHPDFRCARLSQCANFDLLLAQNCPRCKGDLFHH